MLVTFRKVGQVITIGDVTLKVLSISRDRTRVNLGIVAPPTTRVDRAEVRDLQLKGQSQQ